MKHRASVILLYKIHRRGARPLVVRGRAVGADYNKKPAQEAAGQGAAKEVAEAAAAKKTAEGSSLRPSSDQLHWRKRTVVGKRHIRMQSNEPNLEIVTPPKEKRTRNTRPDLCPVSR
ncbi:hypothetical protein V496_10487 [Pseudogymnoascus sp. VKM F-4515 (FW-2607)]|nr:hypothetical protein V496_10487 [Pseudogymnoascus sp. VKM F-4515 (FW-2607)]KFY87645.1 hypothetical protein V498_07071 [Pseudogymnoascus sp. VKM F-4517 (FW-2822)]